MARFSFTGPTSLTATDRDFVNATISHSIRGDEFTTGGARGLDVLAASVCLRNWPFARHRIVTPDAPYEEAMVSLLALGGVEIERMPAGTSYRDRNERLVDYCDEPDDQLVAYVRQATFYRSGEWMTINIAKRRGLDPAIFVLPGEIDPADLDENAEFAREIL